MASPSKAQLLDTIYTLLKKRYKPGSKADQISVMEAVLYGICHEGTTREQANQALARFKDGFFDWNEVRVSSLSEIENALSGLPDPETRAQRLRKFLRQLFIKTYGFSLDSLVKKPQKDAVKALQEYEAVSSDYVLATVIQQGLGGHAIPIDSPLRRALTRLGLADAASDDATLRGARARAVPKNRGTEFVNLMEELVHDVCVENEPECSRCELRKICPTGQQRLSTSKASAASRTNAAVSKPRSTAPTVKTPSSPKSSKPKTAPEESSTPAPKSARSKGPRPK
jgi:endonuclease-3